MRRLQPAHRLQQDRQVLAGFDRADEEQVLLGQAVRLQPGGRRRRGGEPGVVDAERGGGDQRRVEPVGGDHLVGDGPARGEHGAGAPQPAGDEIAVAGGGGRDRVRGPQVGQVVDGEHAAGVAQRREDEVGPVHDVRSAGEPFHGRLLAADPGVLEQSRRGSAGGRAHPRRQAPGELVEPAPRERRRRQLPGGVEPGEAGQQVLGVAADAGAPPEQRRAVEHDPHPVPPAAVVSLPRCPVPASPRPGQPMSRSVLVPVSPGAGQSW
ncbi:hypothetical protein UK82_06865 [Frankia sp. ACN1ag]|nr:hypothetical protein UK82_06865 [Frankia sp. ACN1ag]